MGVKYFSKAIFREFSDSYVLHLWKAVFNAFHGRRALHPARRLWEGLKTVLYVSCFRIEKGQYYGGNHGRV